MIQFILEAIAFQLVFLVVYDFFLKRETFFQWNRLYLIGTYFLSLILPWIKLEVLSRSIPESYKFYPEFLWGLNSAVMMQSQTKDSGLLSMPPEYLIMFGGMILASLLFGYKLFKIYQLRSKGEIHYFPKFTRIVITNSDLAFSFFRSIFLGDKTVQKEHQSIIQHELVHIEQRHTLDLLFFELMRIIGWFNPLVYVYQKRISELHEYIADAKVAKTHKKEQYQMLLSQVFQTQNISFINQFFKSSLIKKRIVMLQKNKSRKIWKLKYLFLIPIIGAMLIYSSCQRESSSEAIETIAVNNVEDLSEQEEKSVFNRLINLSVSDKDWKLNVVDKNSTISFSKAPINSFISGPGNVPINAKMVIQSRVLDDDFDPFVKSRETSPWKVSYGKNSTPEKNLQMVYSELQAERNRMAQSSPVDDTILKNMDLQLESLKEQIIDQNDGDVPFGWADQVPVFPGCEAVSDKRACFQERIQTHIRKHFNYPEEAKEKGIQGRVNLMFIINTDGVVTNLKMRGPHKILEDEVKRIIGRLPNFKPGFYKGEAVDIPFSIPITFKL